MFSCSFNNSVWGGEGVTFYFLFAALVYVALPNSGATLRGANFFSEELTIIKKGGKKKFEMAPILPRNACPL